MMEYVPCPLYMQELSLLTEALRAGFGHLAVCIPHKVGILQRSLDLFAARSPTATRKKSLDTWGLVFADAFREGLGERS
jgi:hypothetical protein